MNMPASRRTFLAATGTALVATAAGPARARADGAAGRSVAAWALAGRPNSP
jgi:hypothetical protein